ncbi:CDP-alcohol phosphatidyltransferase family protein [Enterococcus gallinarum]|nr:CDP-alcohol phosphatidyltransferase family protein [Enterococcus gallinarum]RGC49932.1 CDP-alcohol phosphatidyltransferase family protein [Enterococcus gallinarum]
MGQKKKEGITINYLPNLLSIARIALAGLLLINQQPLFSVCYLICGLTDVLDGFIARNYRLQTTLGSKLDS